MISFDALVNDGLASSAAISVCLLESSRSPRHGNVTEEMRGRESSNVFTGRSHTAFRSKPVVCTQKKFHFSFVFTRGIFNSGILQGPTVGRCEAFFFIGAATHLSIYEALPEPCSKQKRE